MTSVPAKEMLATLLKSATLTARDRETFEGMWDAVHRYGGLSRKQTAWIEDVYYKQKLNETGKAVAKKRSPKVGFILDPKATTLKKARSIDQFQALCPEVLKDSPLYKKVVLFFKSGGEVFELRPSSVPPKASKV